MTIAMETKNQVCYISDALHIGSATYQVRYKIKGMIISVETISYLKQNSFHGKYFLSETKQLTWKLNLKVWSLTWKLFPIASKIVDTESKSKVWPLECFLRETKWLGIPTISYPQQNSFHGKYQVWYMYQVCYKYRMCYMYRVCYLYRVCYK